MENLEQFFIDQEKNCVEFLLGQNERENIDFWKFRESLTEAQKIEGKLLGFDISVPINYMDIFLKKSKEQINKLLPELNFIFLDI